MISENDFANRLYYNYEEFFEPALKQRRFKHSDILPLISKLKDKNIFTIRKAGVSTEGREIFLISAGSGKTKVFLWSQMHGDESTATMAIFDIFNFILSPKSFDNELKQILKKLTIYFMPMVNPDGAEYFRRRNILDIDINRDAGRLASKEGRLLQSVFSMLKPDFGFNLHDQSNEYSAGKSSRPATISFLAPPADEERSMPRGRKKAALLISEMNREISRFIPGHIGRYTDEFEPRAFGDNFQKAGASTILIESGGWKNDTEKLFIRKINFIALLSAFRSIALNSWKKEHISGYESIPLNQELLKDVIIRNLLLVRNGKRAKIDLGLKLQEINISNSSNFYIKSIIEEIGDLSNLYAYEDYDLRGMTVEYGKTYPKKFNSLKELKNTDFFALYKGGYTNILLKGTGNMEFAEFPVNISRNMVQENDAFLIEKPANLVFRKNGTVKYVMINGFLVNMKGKTGHVRNGLVHC